MAFPAMESRTPTADDAVGGAANTGDIAAVSHSAIVPATVVSAGSLLMLFGRVAGAGAVTLDDTAHSATWTIAQDSSDASDDVTFWAYRDQLANGTEAGTLGPTINHGSARMAAIYHSITGAADPAVTPPQASTVAVGTSTTPNPTTCTPTGGAKDYLWIWFGGWEGEQTLNKTAATNFGTFDLDVSCGTAGSVTANCQIKAGFFASNAASMDPAAVTLSASDDWAAWCIAVHPAAAATPSLAYMPPRTATTYVR